MTDGDVQGCSGRGQGSDQTSESLLVRVRARDEQAWRRLVDLYEPLVVYWCRGFGLRDDDAADVAQEVFGTVARSIETYRHDRPGDTFRGWLHSITRSRALDALRARKGQAAGAGGSDALANLLAVPDESAGPGSSDENDRQILVRRALELILGSFEEKSRRAFLKVVLAGEHPAEVARDLGMTPNAVYLATSRVKRRIRQEFAQVLDL